MMIYRNVATVMAATLLLQVALGALGVALPLVMNAAQWSAVSIGAVIAGYSAGFMAGAFTAPRIIRSIGHIRAYAAYAGGAAATTLALALDSDFTWWLLARFAFGVCAAGIFAVAESWIADATPSERRGTVISAYQIVGRAGLILGPFVIALSGLMLDDTFVMAGIFLSLALIPIVFTRRGEPALPTGTTVSPLRLLTIAPAAAVAVFFAGIVNTGTLAFMPIWAETLQADSPAGAAALVLAVIYTLAMLVQWPAGWISDRIDRRLVIAGLAALSAFFAILLAVLLNPGLIGGAVLAGLWGASSLAYYAVGVAHAADRSRVEDLPAIASGTLLVWAAGAVLGPILSGIAYAGPLGARGLFLFAAVFSALLAAGMLWRRSVRKPVREEEREPFVYLSATSASLAEIDAPGDEDDGHDDDADAPLAPDMPDAEPEPEPRP